MSQRICALPGHIAGSNGISEEMGNGIPPSSEGVKWCPNLYSSASLSP